MMRSFLSGPPKPHPVMTTTSSTLATEITGMQSSVDKSAIFTGYLSDISDDEHQIEDDSDLDRHADDERPMRASDHETLVSPVAETQFHTTHPPPPKRRRLNVPSHVERQRVWKERWDSLEKALFDIEKLIASKKTKFDAGREGLQARRARAIQSYLFMVLKNKRNGRDASERAAEVQGFSVIWGGRLVRQWVRKWIDSRLVFESPVFCGFLAIFGTVEAGAIKKKLCHESRCLKQVIFPV